MVFSSFVGVVQGGCHFLSFLEIRFQYAYIHVEGTHDIIILLDMYHVCICVQIDRLLVKIRLLTLFALQVFMRRSRT